MSLKNVQWTETLHLKAFTVKHLQKSVAISDDLGKQKHPKIYFIYYTSYK